MVLKLLPEMVTVVPAEPEAGLIAAIEGGGAGTTYVKMGPVAVPSIVVTVTAPVVPVAGAVAIISVAVALVITATPPLNLTVLSERVVLKCVPVIVTAVPAGPDTGLMVLMVGGVGMAIGGLLLLQAAAIIKNMLAVIQGKNNFLFICLLFTCKQT
jgi:hypothetical protein